jgi:hypothetical protein
LRFAAAILQFADEKGGAACADACFAVIQRSFADENAGCAHETPAFADETRAYVNEARCRQMNFLWLFQLRSSYLFIERDTHTPFLFFFLRRAAMPNYCHQPHSAPHDRTGAVGAAPYHH